MSSNSGGEGVGANAEEKASGGWYADPYGEAARRWYEPKEGWTDRVEGEGEEPDKTGLPRLDEAAVTPPGADRPLDEDGEPEPLSRPVDPFDLLDVEKDSGSGSGDSPRE